MILQLPDNAASVWTVAERKAWQLPEKITVSEWADRHRVLTAKTSPRPGQWRTSRTPYLRPVMDAASDDRVRRITFVKPTQVGGTECIFNAFGYFVDQDPGPTMFLYPTEKLAKRISKDRVKPVFDASPRLRGYRPKHKDDFANLEYRLGSCNVYLAGGNSVTDLASFPLRYLMIDEADKFPDTIGDEGSPIELAIERTNNFDDRKIIAACTPTTAHGWILMSFDASDQKHLYWPCVKCGQYQIPNFKQLRWPDELKHNPEKLKAEEAARYHCVFCDYAMDNDEKTVAVDRFVYAPMKDSKTPWPIKPNGIPAEEIPFSAHQGFRCDAFVSPFRTLSDIAAKFLNSKGDRRKLKVFVCSWLAKPWKDTTKETSLEYLKRLPGFYLLGTVPKEAVMLTGGCDVQKDHFYFTIRAWGPGGQSWLVRRERAADWATVRAALVEECYRVEGDAQPPMPVTLSCVDSNYDTDNVYERCRQDSDRLRPVRGLEHVSTGILNAVKIDRHPVTGLPLKYSLIRWDIDTNNFKDALDDAIHCGDKDDETRRWFLPGDIDQTYLRQMSAEHKVEKLKKRSGKVEEVWEKKGTGRANHYWDCEVYTLVAARMLRVDKLPAEYVVHAPAQQKPRPKPKRGGSSRW